MDIMDRSRTHSRNRFGWTSWTAAEHTVGTDLDGHHGPLQNTQWEQIWMDIMVRSRTHSKNRFGWTSWSAAEDTVGTDLDGHHGPQQNTQ